MPFKALFLRSHCGAPTVARKGLKQRGSMLGVGVQAQPAAEAGQEEEEGEEEARWQLGEGDMEQVCVCQETLLQCRGR